MFKEWTADDWMNHILFFGSLLILVYTFVFA